jgi:polysaccharide export outer membrane protein
MPVYLFSCAAPKKLPGFLENVVDTSRSNPLITPELRIQKYDQLSIQVYSTSTKGEVSDAIYNLPCAGASGAGSCSFLVDVNGEIEYPRLGIFHVEGLTKQELANQIKKRLTVPVELLKDPNVIIRFLNFKITVLGEVASPGSISVPGERLTILEAIGLSGDFTQYGKKDKVKIIREVDGKIEIGFIDLSSKSLFDSPYYNLIQNDVVLIEPTKQKSKMVDQAAISQRIALIVSILGSFTVIYSIIRPNN